MKKIFGLTILFLLLFAFSVFAVEPGYPPTGNAANIDQVGKNRAVIVQTGSLDWAYINQNGTNFGTNGSGDWKYGAFIDQLGNSNIAKIMMPTSDNGTAISQAGNRNEGYQYIGAPIHKTTSLTDMGLDIEQSGGNDNWAVQVTKSSFGCYGIQGMAVEQVGNRNFSYQLSVGGAYGATMKIFQHGDDNDYNVNVAGTGLASPLALPYTFYNAGSYLTPSPTTKTPPGVIKYAQYQNQMYGRAWMNVAGSRNHTAQYQEYSVWSLSGRHIADMDIVGNDNNVAQGQLGEYDVADVDITGSNDVASQSQKGDSNYAKIDTVGNSNVAGQQQTGNSHSSTIFQNGNGNFATVVEGP